MAILDKILNLPIPLLNHWLYWIVLFFALVESSPIFGLAIPGQTVVIIGGFFAELGVVDVGDVIFAAALGAILGDLIGYALGKKYGAGFIKKYGKYVLFKKEHFDQTKRVMNSHAGKTLVIGRFNSLTRAFAPFVAGSANVGFIKFMAYDIAGGISWATVFVLVGYVFGTSYRTATKYIEWSVVAFIFLTIAAAYLYGVARKRKKLLSKKNSK